MIYLPAWPPGISLKWPSLPGRSEADLGFSSTAVLLGSFKRRMRLGFLYFGTVNWDTGKDILVTIRIVGRKRQQERAGPRILETLQTSLGFFLLVGRPKRRGTDPSGSVC